ncbi:MAG: dicarboxylate/amino acid:cation symporter, partial [Schaalia sp.]|nr:dicarboxylate/amino acid:cation symporter [Schaalia sp.]
MRAFLRKSGILVWVIAAIILATVLGSVRVGGDHLVPVEIGRIFATFSAIFSQFLSFSIPLIIIGLVTPAIADLGRGAGKWLGITTAIAYASTLFSGFLTYLVCASLFPRLLASTQLADVAEPGSALESYFTIEMPAPLQVMTALLLSFVVGLGLSMVPRGVLRKGFIEFRAIITRL